MEKIFEKDPEGSFGEGAGKLPHRYSLGDAWLLYKIPAAFCFYHKDVPYLVS